MAQINLPKKQEQTHREQTCVCPGEPEIWRDGERVWAWQVQALTHRMINNRVLLCSTGNSIQHPGLDHKGKEHDKECDRDSWCTLLCGRN